MSMYGDKKRVWVKNFDKLLGVDLTSEILKRLSMKAVHRFKTVCKRWCDIISTKFFVASYVVHHQNQKTTPIPFGLFHQEIINPRIGITTTNALVYANNNNNRLLFQSPGFTSSLSSSSSTLIVLASTNGLFLCSNTIHSHTSYYICNPLTNRRVSTPPPPSAGLEWEYIGFLCKANSGFIIVRIPIYGERITGSILKAEIYDSENGQWAESELDGSWKLDFERYMFIYTTRRVSHSAVTCKGLLHWRSSRRVFVFDPSNTTKKCRMIKLPPPPVEEMLYPLDDCYLGECKGKLMYTLFKHLNFTVWQLKDYDNNDGDGEWSLLHNVLLDQMVFVDPFVMKYLGGNYIADFRFLAFHPFNEDIIFICIVRRIVLVFNMKEKTGTEICLMPSGTGMCYFMSYLVLLPWWPFPI